MNANRILTVGSLAILAACGDNAATEPVITDGGGGTGLVISSDGLYTWNEIATDYIALDTQPGPAPVSPMMEAQVYAMVNGAMHDVLNAMYPRFERLAYMQPAPAACTSPNIAVATAALTVLRGISAQYEQPAAPLAYVQRRYDDAMERYPLDSVRAACTTFGHEVGSAMLANRAHDKASFQGLSAYTSSGEPGMYRPTPPFAGEGVNASIGLADGQAWASVAPWVLSSATQFRPDPPYGTTDVAQALASEAYSRDFDEVKRLGGVVSERTQDQTDIAFFWMESSPRTWNRIARILALNHNLPTLEAARLLALVSMAEADAYVAAFDAKYTFRFWRPITAIRLADITGNSATVADPTWDVASAAIGVPTPPVPDYVSGHAAAGGAAAAVITAVMNNDTGFELATKTLPDHVRTFASVSDAAAENAESRILIGYHFRSATEAGLRLGANVGGFIAEQALARLR